MNKYLLTSLLALVLLLSGCIFDRGDNSTNNNNPNNNQEEQKGNQDSKDNENEQKDSEIETITIEEYYPIEENVRYVYEGKGNEYASYDVYIDYVTEHKVQQRNNNGGTSLVRIIEIKDGKLINTYSRGETYYRENLLKTQNGEEEVLLMEPLKVGTTWKLNDSSVRTITNLSADISTPSGNYKAIEVSTEGPNGKTLEYYVKGIGLVKTLFNAEGAEVSSSLSKIEKNVPFVQTIQFFYPNINDEQLYFESKEISFHTNDITKMVLEKAYKESVPNAVNPVFTQNTKINSLYLNQDNNLYIDLNKAFLTEMVAGAGLEGKILQSIVNTFGHYYGVEKVYLTIDNELYSSGHISLNKGEFLTVTPIEEAIDIHQSR
jgi:hypothetical protein